MISSFLPTPSNHNKRTFCHLRATNTFIIILCCLEIHSENRKQNRSCFYSFEEFHLFMTDLTNWWISGISITWIECRNIKCLVFFLRIMIDYDGISVNYHSVPFDYDSNLKVMKNLFRNSKYVDGNWKKRSNCVAFFASFANVGN